MSEVSMLFDFEGALLRAFGLESQKVKALRLHMEVGQFPKLEVEMLATESQPGELTSVVEQYEFDVQRRERIRESTAKANAVEVRDDEARPI